MGGVPGGFRAVLVWTADCDAARVTWLVVAGALRVVQAISGAVVGALRVARAWVVVAPGFPEVVAVAGARHGCLGGRGDCPDDGSGRRVGHLVEVFVVQILEVARSPMPLPQIESGLDCLYSFSFSFCVVPSAIGSHRSHSRSQASLLPAHHFQLAGPWLKFLPDSPAIGPI